jgi:chemotaxis protein CheX
MPAQPRTVEHSEVKVEYINPFVSSTVSVFETMLSCQLSRQPLQAKDHVQPEHEISGIIGLSGKASGIVVLSVSRDVALAATESMLGERPAGIDADVADVIGELTNMIAGSAKAKLAQLEMSVGLPTVITGRNHIVNFPPKTTPLCIPFLASWGPLCLEVSLTENVVGEPKAPSAAALATSTQ